MGGVLAVQNIHKWITDCGGEKSPYSVHDGVPMRVPDIVAGNLAENFAGENMNEYDYLQAGGKGNSEPLLQQWRQSEQIQHQRTDKYIFIVSMVVLALSIVWRYFLKDSPININKWENTNSKLENSIYKATLLEESLEKMLKESSYNTVNECEIKDN